MSKLYAEPTDIRRTQRHIITMRERRPDPNLQPALMEPAGATAEKTIQRQFEEFNANNPDIYLALRDMALSQARSGVKPVRVKFLVEQLRSRKIAVDNRFTSRYARLLDLVPELTGLIAMKSLSAE